MTKEEKELLFQDLCARLPYHPFAYGKSGYVYNEGRLILVTSSGCTIMTGGGSHAHYFFNEIKLYLRPMSSMTRTEVLEYISLKESIVASDDITYYFETYKSIDWLNAHHFDYRGLIEKGLALEAPEGIYEFK